MWIYILSLVALQRFARQRSLCNCTCADPYQISSTEVPADLYARRSTPSHTFTVFYAGLRESVSSERLADICSLDLRRLAAWLIDAETYSRVSKQNYAWCICMDLRFVRLAEIHTFSNCCWFTQAGE